MPLERFKHQSELFNATKDLRSFALLWEMRVGKNLPVLDTAKHLHRAEEIDAVLIIAPSGVHTNWSRKVIPPELPEATVYEWTGKPNKTQTKRLAEIFRDEDRLLFVCVNVEALVTDAWQDFQAQLTKSKRTMRVIDESDTLKNPTAKRTKYAIKTTGDFPYRRILTGTSAPNSPFDLWSQYACLDKNIIGIDRFTTFKQRYGIFKRVQFGGPSFDQLVSYRDLGHLTERIMRFSSRLTQKEVYEDLPPVIAVTRSFQMTDAQQAAYNSMRDDMMWQINEGLVLTATQAITVMMRLQQISRGFVGLGDGTVHKIEGKQPSVEALLQALAYIEGKSIVWCNNTEDVNSLMTALTAEGYSPARYDGQVDAETRYENKERFLTNNACRVLVGTPATGGVGLDVSIADSTIFYSHSYKLRERLQAIARNQGPNQKAKKLLLVSIVGEGTGDAACIKRLEEKRLMMSALMGDKLFDAADAADTSEDYTAILKQFLAGDQDHV